MKTNTIERRPIKGCTNFEIDTNGKVWDIRTNTKCKEYVNPAGFSYVILDRRIHTVAYLMKAAFFQNDPNICIRHKDGNRTNNKLANLYTFFDGSETLSTREREKQILFMEVNPDNNEVIKFWNSSREAADQYGIDRKRINYAARTARVVDGHKFEIYNRTLDGIGLFDYTDGKHLIQIRDEYGNSIATAKGLEEARQITGDSHTAIISHLNGCYDIETSKRGYRYGWKLSTVPEPVKEPKAKKVKEPKPLIYKRKVCQYTIKGELIKIHNNMREASAATVIATSNLCVSLVNDNRTAGGYVWRYEGEAFDYTVKPKVTKAIKKPRLCKRVCQYSLKGTLINTFESIGEAARQTNTPHCAISNTANGKRSVANGCVWRWEGEPFDKYAQPIRPRKRKVYQMRKAEDGNGFVIIEEWNSLTDAARELGHPVSTLAKVAAERGKKQYKDGYYYSYSTF